MPAVYDLTRSTSMGGSAVPQMKNPSSTQGMRRVSSSSSHLSMTGRNSANGLSSMSLGSSCQSLRRNGSMSASSSSQNLRRNSSSTGLSSNEQKSVSGMDHELWKELRRELAFKKAQSGAAVSEVTRSFLEKKQVIIDRDASPAVDQPEVNLKKNTNLRAFQDISGGPSDESPIQRGHANRRHTTVIGEGFSKKKNLLVSSMQKWQSLRSVVMSSMDALAEEVEEGTPSDPSARALTLTSDSNIAINEDSFTDIFNKDLTPRKSTDFTGTLNDSIENLLLESTKLVVPSPDGSESLVFEQSGSELLCSFETGPMRGKRSSITAGDTKTKEDLCKILEAAGEMSLEDDE